MGLPHGWQRFPMTIVQRTCSGYSKRNEEKIKIQHFSTCAWGIKSSAVKVHVNTNATGRPCRANFRKMGINYLTLRPGPAFLLFLFFCRSSVLTFEIFRPSVPAEKYGSKSIFNINLQCVGWPTHVVAFLLVFSAGRPTLGRVCRKTRASGA